MQIPLPFLIAGCLFAPWITRAAESAKPNVVYLLADDLGWSDLSIHPGGNIPTPHIDRLFEQGVELSNFMGWCVCSPTRAMLLTGRHPFRVGTGPETGGELEKAEATIAEGFKANGYRTGIFGKWHNGEDPDTPEYRAAFAEAFKAMPNKEFKGGLGVNEHGFDDAWVYYGGGADYFTRRTSAGKGPVSWWHNREYRPQDAGYTEDFITQHALEFIRDNKDHPFFCYVPFHIVHTPLQAKDPDLAAVDAKVTDATKRTYTAMVQALDKNVDTILAELDKLGLRDNTILVFGSDNGATKDGSNLPFRGGKHTIFEGGTHLPTVIHWPKGNLVSRKWDGLCGALDMFPSLLAMADLKMPATRPLDGKNIWPALRDNSASPVESYYWSWHTEDAIRTADWRMHRFCNHVELYDIRDDISETRDVADSHPEVVKSEGEKYRDMLVQRAEACGLQDHIRFINKYVSLQELLEYLQLTDIYLFTTNDPNQAVSGTFAYAMSCACPIISTPIPHALELLDDETGIIFDFRNSTQLAAGVNRLLSDEPLRRRISLNTLEKIAPTSWENSAVAHAMLFKKTCGENITIRYNLPAINLDHVKQMTTDTGIIQFSKINQPDLATGYTLDDNARALVATCMYFKHTGDENCLSDIYKYLNFISHCQQAGGDFFNYTDQDNNFTEQNTTTNLDDSNGRAVWALGYLISMIEPLPLKIISEAEIILKKSLLRFEEVHSTRAMAFAIKGIYYYHSVIKSPENVALVKILANRMVQMFRHESDENWVWFEGYLTYANSILPEAMLYAWLMTQDTTYREIAASSFTFLLSQTFNDIGIRVISNKSWKKRGRKAVLFGEQPIDVAYTIMTLGKFYDVFRDEDYLAKMKTAFSWFLGNNHLHQVIYNPCTGGCFDGLEETRVNLNQGAESTVSYLMARLTMKNDQEAEPALRVPSHYRKRIVNHVKSCCYSTDYKKDTAGFAVFQNHDSDLTVKLTGS